MYVALLKALRSVLPEETREVVTPKLAPGQLGLSLDDAYERMNKPLAEKYPQLTEAFRDPTAFRKNIQARFAEQRALTPADPYQFDFSDYGLPVLRDLDSAIASKQTELTKLAESDFVKTRSPKKNAARVAELSVGQKYLAKLAEEVKGYLSNEKVTYRQLNEVTQFASPALGYFDVHKLTRVQRVFLSFDRGLEQYEKLPIAKEYAKYLRREYDIFTRYGPESKQRRKAFEAAYVDPNELRVIQLPTMTSLADEPFLRLLPHGIVLKGITAEPLPADGFLRPGKDFSLHDDVHNSNIIVRWENYVKDHGLNEDEEERLRKMIDVWRSELDEEMKLMPTDLGRAVHLALFNRHHDRGYPVLPSVYKMMMIAQPVPILLDSILRASDQDPKYEHQFRNLSKAQVFLQEFFAQRLPQERAIWAEAAARRTAKAPSLGWSEHAVAG